MNSTKALQQKISVSGAAAAVSEPNSNSDVCVPVELMDLIARVRVISHDRMLRLPEVTDRTGRAVSTTWKDIAQKVFPGQVSLGPRSVGWKESEVSAWMEARAFATRTGQPGDMKKFVALLTAPKACGSAK